MTRTHDIDILRALAEQYAEEAAKSIQNERRALWRAHLSLKPTRIPVLVTYGLWNVWCRDVFGEDRLSCQDPFFRAHEQTLRMQLFHASIGDDYVLEPWINQRADIITPPEGLWGVREGKVGEEYSESGGSWKYDPPIKAWSDVGHLISPHHRVNEAETALRVERLQEAVGDILTVNIDRSPAYFSFDGDISTHLAYLRGLEQLMFDMSDSPAELHALLAFMRDGILDVHAEAEQAGDWNRANQKNQVMCYAEELADPRPNANQQMRRDLWYHVAAQEFTLVSPQMHQEFLLQYQLPIISQFGLVTYGCCENLTHKIGMLRQIPNLRIIAVTPTADVAKCAAQIQQDYVFSWRPNPARMVCVGFDPQRVKAELQQGLEAAQGCCVHLLLKDVETVEGDLTRLKRWTETARAACDDL